MLNGRFLKQYQSEIIIVSFFFLLALFFNRYILASDGRLYYLILEYIVFPHLNPHPLPLMPIDAGGYQQFGVIFFWLPFYLISALLSNLSIFNFAAIKMPNGFMSLTTIFITLAGNFYTLLALLLSLDILRLYKFEVNKIFVIFAVFLSTPLFVYGIPLAHFNHAVDTFILTLFIYLFLIGKDKKPFFQFFLGILIAVGVSVRYLNVSILVFLLSYYFILKKMESAKFIFLGFLSIIWVLPLSHYLVNGSFFKPLIFSIHGTTNSLSSISNFLPKYTLKLLFHPIHGLFVWSPITILSFYGLIQFYQEDKKVALFFIGIFLSLALSQGWFPAWHAGWSFSQRYLTGMFPVFVFGFGYYLSKYPKSGLILGTIFTVYSLFLLLNWGSVIHAEFGTPIDMIQAWISKRDSLSLMIAKVYRTLLFLR